jgi:hypothetical protein
MEMECWSDGVMGHGTSSPVPFEEGQSSPGGWRMKALSKVFMCNADG